MTCLDSNIKGYDVLWQLFSLLLKGFLSREDTIIYLGSLYILSFLKEGYV